MLDICQNVDIVEMAFSRCIGVTHLTISEGAEIGNRVFLGCTGITQVTISAVKEGYNYLVIKMLQERAEVNYTFVVGETVLMRAVHKGHKQTAELLIAPGAKVDHSATDGVME